jgi:hypothetical protein
MFLVPTLGDITVLTTRGVPAATGTAILVLAGCALLSGCASSRAFTAAATVGVLPSVAATSAPHSGFEVVPATEVVRYDDVNAVLTPISSAPYSAGAAFAPLASAVRKLDAATTAPVTAATYAYFNSSYGQIRPDGSVKLSYRGTPVWLITVPLAHYLDDAQGKVALSGEPPPPAHAGCRYLFIVDAATNSTLTDWQECAS